MIEKVVIDTNIIVLLLISNNQKIIRALFNSAVIFASPRFVIVELFKHSPKIQKAGKLTADEVLEVLTIIVNKVRFYDEDLVSIGS